MNPCFNHFLTQLFLIEYHVYSILFTIRLISDELPMISLTLLIQEVPLGSFRTACAISVRIKFLIEETKSLQLYSMLTPPRLFFRLFPKFSEDLFLRK